MQYLTDILLGQRLEHYDFINPVQELRTDCFLEDVDDIFLAFKKHILPLLPCRFFSRRIRPFDADNRQTVSAPGVSADELSQLLIPVAAGTAMEAYDDAVVRCRVQAENSLTFTCEEVPAVDLTVYIVIITLA